MADHCRDNKQHSSGELVLDDGHRISYTSIGDEHHPLLLFIVGSSGLGYLYQRLALELSNTFRCVYYDKRGFFPRDTDHQTAENQKNLLVPVERQSDDAAALVRYLSPHRPVCVFGTSTGGTTTLDLTVRYPELVHTAILHEPITFSVMRNTQLKDEMLTLYRTMGAMTDSIKSFAIFADYMFNPPNRKSAAAKWFKQTPNSAVESYNARQGQQEAIAMVQYVVDEERTRKVANKLVLVCGTESVDLPVSEPGKALAEVLGGDVKKLPGDHMSFATKKHAVAFAKELLLILRMNDTARHTNLRPLARI